MDKDANNDFVTKQNCKNKSGKRESYQPSMDSIAQGQI
jgi:hypothetical protein